MLQLCQPGRRLRRGTTLPCRPWKMGSYSEESQVFIIKNGLFLCCQSTRVHTHTHTHTQDYSKEVYRPHVGENVGHLFRVRVRENPVSYLLHTSQAPHTPKSIPILLSFCKSCAPTQTHTHTHTHTQLHLQLGSSITFLTAN